MSGPQSDLLNAALANLTLDLNGGDDAALDIVRSHTGFADLSFAQAQALVDETEASL